MSTLDSAIQTLKDGGVVIFPTDTVWGIGALISNTTAIEKLYQIKNRPLNQPTAVLVGDIYQAKELATFNPIADELAAKYWPGGLTLILPFKTNIPSLIQGEEGSVGLRVPDHPVIQEILNRVGEGIVTSSANFAGGVPPKSRGEINPELIAKIDYLVEVGESGQKDPSTIVDLTHSTPQIVRHGSVDLNFYNFPSAPKKNS